MKTALNLRFYGFCLFIANLLWLKCLYDLIHFSERKPIFSFPSYSIYSYRRLNQNFNKTLGFRSKNGMAISAYKPFGYLHRPSMISLRDFPRGLSAGSSNSNKFDSNSPSDLHSQLSKAKRLLSIPLASSAFQPIAQR